MTNNKTGIMRIKLMDHQGSIQRLLVTNHKEKTLESDAASDDSSLIRHSGENDALKSQPYPISNGASETTVSSPASLRNPAKELCGLQAKLQEAKTQVD